MSSDQNQQGTSILGMPGSNIEYRQESGDLSNQKQSNMNEKHMGAYANPMPEDLGNSTSFSSQGGQTMSTDGSQQSTHMSGDGASGDVMSQNMMRAQMSNNPNMGTYQMPYNQGMPVPGMTGGMNMQNQGMMANNYNTMKHGISSNDPSFVQMQAPGMMHYMQGASGAQHMPANPSNAAQAMPHGMTPQGQQMPQMAQGHSQMNHGGMMMGRPNMMPGHLAGGHQGMPMSGMSQDMHNVQGSQDVNQNQYMQMNSRNVNMQAMHMGTSQMGVGQHIGGQGVNQSGMNMHGYPMQGSGSGQYMPQQAVAMQPTQPGQPVQPGIISQQGHQSSISGRALVPKSWHSHEHAAAKESMVEEIVKLLKSRRPNATEDWHSKLPHMAKRLEEALYNDANSYQEYSDPGTLKHRLQQLALSMGKGQNTARPPSVGQQPQLQQAQAQQQQQQQQQMGAMGMRQLPQQQPQQQPQPGHVPMQYGNPQHMQPQHMQHMPQHNMGHSQVINQPMAVNQQYQQQQYQQRPQGQYGQMQGAMGVPPGNYNMPANMAYPQHGQQHGMPMQQGQPMMQYQMPADQAGNDAYMRAYANSQPHMLGQQGQQPGQQMMPPGNYPQQMMVDDYNSHQAMVAKRVVGNTAQPAMQVPAATHGMPPAGAGQMGNPNIPMMGHPVGQVVHQSMMPPQQAMAPQQMNQAGVQGVPHSDEHRRQVLKQQQQRLLLLRHASKCPHDEGRCPVTPHCWSMKTLWKHIMSCKDQECKVAHCVSSRYVLSHYSKCKETSCPVCAPVREAIKRNYERSKDVVNATKNGVPMGADGHLGAAVGQAHQLTDKSMPAAKKARTSAKDKKAEAAQAAANASTTLTIPRPVQRSIYPLDPISSAVYSFTNEEIAAHFKTIQEGMKLTGSKIREICKPIIDELFKVPHAQGVFGAPVDPVVLGLTDYFDIVKAPMDLGTVQKKLEQGSYRDFNTFAFDVRLTFDNAMLYNPKNSDVYVLAKALKKEFEGKFKTRQMDFERQIEEHRKNADCCLICGELSLKFEPPVYYCNGPCNQRIRRNAVFYSTSSNSYHWCSSCYGSLPDNKPLQYPDISFMKADLVKKKHTEDHDESWVQCEQCQRWVHQVCSLFNARRNTSDEVSYVCPPCLQDKRRKCPDQIIVSPTTKKMKAVDLPTTTLSTFLEKRIHQRLQIAYEEMAEKLNISVSEVEKCPQLTLRQVSCLDKQQQVRDGVYNRYKEKGYPEYFPCRTKCLVLFQTIDGQDVLLFGMYVYEYGHKCPQPNQRRVYISYLDSVNYLRPKQYRTIVYHEILISYLDYVKARGFHTAHIWACPPQKGDDYILYVHPADQKIPKPQTLRIWYDDMLKRCIERGIVEEVTDFHSEYLLDPSYDATVLPYFEGDYWVNEAEVIIKNLSEGNKGSDDRLDDGAGKSKRKAKAKNSVRENARATAVTTGKPERDPVMAKLATIIEPMKDTFFVARLHPREFADRCAEMLVIEANTNKEGEEKNEKELQEEALTGQDVGMSSIDIKAEEARIAEANAASAAAAAAAAAANESANSANEGEDNENDPEGDDFNRIAANIDDNGAAQAADDDNNSMVDGKDSGDDWAAGAEEVAQPPAPPVMERSETLETTAEEEVERRVHVANEPHKSIQAAESVERHEQSGVAESKESEDVPAAAPAESTVTTSTNAARVVVNPKAIIPCGDGLPTLTTDTEDVDDIQECEHLDTRQSFLNLCQGNHYQFDQLRRAKHSSMMVLYHLHNPDAPKFVPNCTVCHADILNGMRFNCKACEVDFCQACVNRVGPSIHKHKLQAIGVNNSSAPMTEEQRRERQRSVQLHMQLLQHASTCVGCNSNNCLRMKEFLKHESECPTKVKGGCRLCARISNLLGIHARQCRAENCKVPHCQSYREQFRRLAQKQQQMDDRRRQQMNLEYSRGGAAAAASDDRDD